MPWAVEEGGCEIMVTIDTTHCGGVLRSDEVWFSKKVKEVSRSQWTLKSVKVASSMFIPELLLQSNIHIETLAHYHPKRPMPNPIPSPPDLIALEPMPPLIFIGVFLPCSLPDHDDTLWL